MGLGRGRQTSKLESLIVATISLAPIYFNGSLRHLLKLRDRCSGVQRADENLLRATPFSDASPISFPNSPRLSLLHPFPTLLHLTPSVPSTHVPNSWHKLFGLSFNKEARERKERGIESRERRDINCKERGGGWRRKEQFREGGRQRL